MLFQWHARLYRIRRWKIQVCAEIRFNFYCCTFNMNCYVTFETIKTLIKGVQAFHFWKHDFKLCLGMYPQLEGGFGSMRAILPMWGLRANNGLKPKTKRNEVELSFLHRSIRLHDLIILVWSDVKIGYKMAELCPFKVGAKVASWSIFGWKLAI